MKNILFTLALLISFVSFGQREKQSIEDKKANQRIINSIEKMGGNMKRFVIIHSEIIDKSKSFTIVNQVSSGDKMGNVASYIFNSIKSKLNDENIITKDLVIDENGKRTYVTDYLIEVYHHGFKIHKGDDEILKVFIKALNARDRKKMNQMIDISTNFDHIFKITTEQILNHQSFKLNTWERLITPNYKIKN